MIHRLKKFACCCATSALLFIPAATTWAVPQNGTAHFSERPAKGRAMLASARVKASQNEGLRGPRLPSLVRFREVGGRGLLVNVWINDAGPYTFAIDTGAGATIVSRRVAGEARVSTNGRRPLMIGGISGAGAISGQEVLVRSLAIGDKYNVLPSGGLVIVTERLAPGVDGVLDPAEAYGSLGFEIDLPRGELTAFDPRTSPLRRNQTRVSDETIVPWLFDGQTRRPFVMLDGRLRALLDTGSGFGLALTKDVAASLGIMPGRGRETAVDIRDLGGGQIAAHRISPATVSIGGLVLRGIPTDLLSNARAGSPILLGREALRPFRLTFDPLNRLIRIVPGSS